MSNVWERFDNIAKPEEVMDAKSQFKPLPEGIYELVLEELAPSTSKNGLPMLKGKFRVKSNNKLVFYNQMLQNLNYPDFTEKNIAQAVSFLEDLTGQEIEFKGLKKLAKFVESIPMGSEHVAEIYYEDNDTEQKWAKIRLVVEEDEVEEVEYDLEYDEDEDEEIEY